MKSKTKYLVLLLAVLWNPFITGAWDKDKPAATTSLRSSNPQMLENQSVIEDALGNEHDFSTGGTQTGDHTQGEARAFSQASAPATRIDGAGFLSTDLGSIWVDTDDNTISYLTATAPTWTDTATKIIADLLGSARVFLGTLGVDGNFEVGTGSEFTVTAASGDIATSGTLNIQSTVAVVGVIDDDTMATATDTTLATSESVKVYTDTFGIKAWGRVNSAGTLLGTGLNITSVTNPITGRYVVTWDTDFADINYAAIITPNDSSANNYTVKIDAVAVGSIAISMTDADSAAAIDAGFSFIATGTQ